MLFPRFSQSVGHSIRLPAGFGVSSYLANTLGADDILGAGLCSAFSGRSGLFSLVLFEADELSGGKLPKTSYEAASMRLMARASHYIDHVSQESKSLSPSNCRIL